MFLLLFLSHFILHADPMIESLAGCLETRDEDVGLETEIKARSQLKNLAEYLDMYVDSAQMQQSVAGCVENSLAARFGASTTWGEMKNDEAKRAQIDRLALYAGMLQGDLLEIKTPGDYLVALKKHSLSEELIVGQNNMADESAAPGLTLGMSFVARQNELAFAYARARFERENSKGEKPK